jgi:hypothetical protein
MFGAACWAQDAGSGEDGVAVIASGEALVMMVTYTGNTDD